MVSDKQLANFIAFAIDLVVNKGVDSMSIIAGCDILISRCEKSQISITITVTKSEIIETKLGIGQAQT